MSRLTLRVFVLALVVMAGVSPPARAGGVRIVDRPALASFGTIQSAVDVAIDGETLLVATGTYTGFTVANKSLAIVAAPTAVVTVQGTIEIDDLGPLRWVALVGLSVTGAMKAAPLQSDPALRMLHNLGHVHVDNCTLRGGAGSGYAANYDYGAGGHGVTLLDSRRVSFVRCNVFGGNGAGNSSSIYQSQGGAGGRAMDAQQSTAALYDSTLTGGKGGNGGELGGRGGDAYHALDFGVVASNTTFTGGKGGDGWDSIYNQAGDGGDGLFVDVGAQAQLVDNIYVGGLAGTSFGAIGPAIAGAGIEGPGIAIQHAGNARTATASTITNDTSVWNVVVSGDPGDHITLAYSTTPGFVVPTPVTGIQLVPASASVIHATVKVPASGIATVRLRIAPITGASPARFLFWQAWLDDSAGARWLASPMHRLVIDRAGLPDCNANGQIDLLDVVQGANADLDHNLVPDACDPDCNANGIIDGLDIANATSADVNHNLVPDSCEQPRTWYVDDNAPPGGDGSAGSPLRTLRAAIDLTLPGDTVLASNGLYVGVDNRELDLHGKNITVKSASGPANCTIDCLGAGRAFYLHTNETLGCVIQGFTIANGYGSSVSPSGLNSGGGILALNASPTVRNCVITACLSESQGGGLWLKGGRVEDCTLSANTARNPAQLSGAGGGLYCGGNVVVVGCRIENNDSIYGGGVAVAALVAPGIALVRCAITGNNARYQGGGLFDGSGGNSLVLIDQCAITGNSAERGGGVATSSSTAVAVSSIEIHNTTLAGNSSTQQGGALYLGFKKNGSLSNSIVWGNSAALGYQILLDHPTGVLSVDACDIENGLASINSGPATLNYGANIALDPLFADSDYRIDDFSPCIDAGDNSLIALDRADSDGDGNINEPAPLDLDHNARRVDDPNVPDTGIGTAPLVDLGAFEHVP